MMRNTEIEISLTMLKVLGIRDGIGSADPSSARFREGTESIRESSSKTTDSEYPGFWTEEGQYLSENVADILIKAVADVNKHRPKDPIGHLAVALYTLRFIRQDFKPSKDIYNFGNPGSGSSNDSTIAKRAAFENGTNPVNEFSETECLLKHRNADGSNILHFAASIPHEESVFFRLICHTKEAKLSDRDSLYLTPRDVAADNMVLNNIIEIDKWVLRQAAEGNLEAMKSLLIEGYPYVLELMDSSEKNILEIAATHGQQQMVEFLQLAPAFEERRDFLHKAIKVGSFPHVEFMVDSEDIARAKDSKGRTALHIATLCEEREIMTFLAQKYSALLCIGDNLDRTPLHYAMAVENVDEVAKILVQAGARRTVKDLKGKSPSFYFMHRDEIVAMIKEIYTEEMDNEFR